MNEGTTNRLYKGYWFLPFAPDKQVAGVLTLESDGQAVLELIGAFGERPGADLENSYEPAVWGRCYDVNKHRGTSITLLNCGVSYTYNWELGFPLVRYSGQMAMIGIHVLSDHEPLFFRSLIHFKELSIWCPPGTIETVHKTDSITVSVDKKRGEEAVLSSVVLDDSVELRLVKGASFWTDYLRSYQIEPETLLEVLKDGMMARQVLAVARRFEEFFSFVALCPLGYGRITLYSEQEAQEQEDGKKYYHPIELITRSERSTSETEIKPHLFLMKYADIASDFGQMFKRYYSDTAIKQIWVNMLASLEQRHVFTSNDFLIVAQAVDGFSLRFREESSFLAQLQALREEYRDVEKLTLTDKDLLEVRGSRNYYSHILKLDEKEKKQAVDGMELYELTKKLQILLICCLLSFLGMDNARINNLLNHCHNSLLWSES